VTNHWRRGWRFVALVAVLGLLAGACTGDEQPEEPEELEIEEDEEEPEEERAIDPDDYCADAGSGPLTWVHEQEPPDLHFDDPDNGLLITSWIQQGLLEGAFGVSADTAFVEELVDTAEVSEDDDGFVYRYELREDLQWSDGEPLTAEHFEQTYELILDGVDLDEEDPTQDATLAFEDRGDYLRIVPGSFEVEDELTFSYATEEFFAGWPTLFERVYPTHVLSDDGEEANEQLAEFEVDGEPLPSSGPFVFSRWVEGTGIALDANEDYHGRHPDNDDVVNNGAPCVDGVEIRFLTSAEQMVQALTAGEGDLLFTQPQVAFGERIVPSDGLTVASSPGTAWEHWGFNLHAPHVSRPEVREAIAYAIDKPQLMELIYTPLYGDLLPEEGLGNVYWMSHQPDYEDHTTPLGYGSGDRDAAAELMEEAGYELDDEGIWEHPDDGTATLRVGTTGGNQIRELQQQVLQQQLNRAGFDIVLDNVAGTAYFSQRPFAEEHTECVTSGGEDGNCELWEIAQFAWLGGPWPGDSHISFLGRSPNNPYGYDDEDFDELVFECEEEIDDAARADCYQVLSRVLTTREVDDDGLVVIPLTQKPQFYAYADENLRRAALAPDFRSGGPLVYGVDHLLE
jgi:peptide/nickel transport system substrate-binding protein